MKPEAKAWLREFMDESSPVVSDPFKLAILSSIAALESGWGARSITHGDMLNEIGYKAIAGKPSIEVKTRETGIVGIVKRAFRLFRGRAEQANSARYLMDESIYFDAARLLYILALYASYTNSNVAGMIALVKVYNEIAEHSDHLKPIRIIDKDCPHGIWDMNHEAASAAVMAFAELTRR